MFLKCTFEENKGISLIAAIDSNVTITRSTFRDNADIHILSYIFCNAMFVNSTFIDNKGKHSTFLTINVDQAT